MVNPILVPAFATDDQPKPTVFLAVTKKFDIATQTLRELPVIEKTPVNSNQGNNTTENFLEASDCLHISNIIIALNNGHLILKI